MTPPKLIFFDLDGTLTESKQPLTPDMAALLAQLLEKYAVAIISGGALAQFMTQVVERLPEEAERSNLYLLPTSGAALHEWRQGRWNKVYEERLSEKDAQTIEAVMRTVATECGLVDFSTPAYGERIEYRGSQVTLSTLGQQAPVALKKAWDPDKSKRRALREAIAAKLPGFLVVMGGSTSIDVTKEHIDKAYGIHQLCAHLGIDESDAQYFGDELVAGGNDEAVFKTNAQARAVASPEETAHAIVSLLS